MKLRITTLLLVGIILLTATAPAAADAVVLVASSESDVSEISSLDIRKAYLGISVFNNGYQLRAVRRQGDDRLNRIFLQAVIAMTERSYERRLLSLALKFGTPRPTEIDDEQLAERLVNSPASITYMWKSAAESDPRIRIIRVLWQEN